MCFIYSYISVGFLSKLKLKSNPTKIEKKNYYLANNKNSDLTHHLKKPQ